MLAVNGYNESKAVVESYVKKAGLKQKILLAGGNVASKKYLVKGYPTTFLIDRKGTIVRRYVGFSPSSAPAKARDIEAMLRKGAVGK